VSIQPTDLQQVDSLGIEQELIGTIVNIGSWPTSGYRATGVACATLGMFRTSAFGPNRPMLAKSEPKGGY
jgi:hypothetical protein